jgi:hypothetical protein
LSHFNGLGLDHRKGNLAHAHIFNFAQLDGCGPEHRKGARMNPIASTYSAFHFSYLFGLNIQNMIVSNFPANISSMGGKF